MLANPLKQKLAKGAIVTGAWSLIPSPMAVEAMAHGGLDFVIIDMEHGTFDTASVDACVRACEAAGCSPLVRIPGMNLSAAQWALDSGAHGIIVPQVDGLEQAKQAVALAKFPPEGMRGYNPFVRAGNYAGAKGGKLSNDFTLSAIIVETRRSLDELEAICALPGLDVVYIGVYDLSVVLGHAGDVSHAEIQAIVKQSVATITKAGKTAGMMVRSRDDMQAAHALGARFILCGVDTNILRNAVSGLL